MAKDSQSKRVSRNSERAKEQAREAYNQGRQIFICRGREFAPVLD